jgi:hypothetical protein
MFSLFKRKKGRYPSESKWSVLQGQYQNHPMIVRRNYSAKDLLGDPDYKYRIGIAVTLLSPNESVS